MCLLLCLLPHGLDVLVESPHFLIQLGRARLCLRFGLLHPAIQLRFQLVAFLYELVITLTHGTRLGLLLFQFILVLLLDVDDFSRFGFCLVQSVLHGLNFALMHGLGIIECLLLLPHLVFHVHHTLGEHVGTLLRQHDAVLGLVDRGNRLR